LAGALDQADDFAKDDSWAGARLGTTTNAPVLAGLVFREGFFMARAISVPIPSSVSGRGCTRVPPMTKRRFDDALK